MFLHYLVKHENNNCYRLQCRIARETSKLLLQHMRQL